MYGYTASSAGHQAVQFYMLGVKWHEPLLFRALHEGMYSATERLFTVM
jgi:hypothetical protein